MEGRLGLGGRRFELADPRLERLVPCVARAAVRRVLVLLYELALFAFEGRDLAAGLDQHCIVHIRLLLVHDPATWAPPSERP